jgi:hypothetical protein
MPGLDEPEYMQRIATRPLTSAIAVVKADGAATFACRPQRKPARRGRTRLLFSRSGCDAWRREGGDSRC